MSEPAQEGAKAKTAGRAIAITTLSPVIPRRLGRLRRGLRVVRYVPGLGRPLLELAFIYFGRWTVIKKLPAADGGGSATKLKSPYLLFESNYDGSWSGYLNAFADRLPGRLARLWGSCYTWDDTVGKTGDADGRLFQPFAFKDYVHRNEIDVLHFYSAYPEATTRDVSQAIAIGDRARAGADPRLASLALGPAPPSQGRLAKLRDTAAGWLRNITGRYGVRPLTIALPIHPQEADALTRDLCDLSPDSSPLANVGDTHFARFALLRPELKALGQREPDLLKCPYLLFTSNHDGPNRAYLRALATHMQADGERIWRACRGYPGPGDPKLIADWLGRHAIRTNYFVMGYPPRTVNEIKTLLAHRARLADGFAVLAPPGRQGAATALREDQIQGNVLRAYGVRFARASYLLLRVKPDRGADARRLLAVWGDRVTFGRREPSARVDVQEPPHLNIAFSFSGLRALGVPPGVLAQFPEEFQEGAALRSERLGDHGDSACARWEFGQLPSDVLLIVHASDKGSLTRCVERVLTELHGAGDPMVISHRQPAGLLRRRPSRSDADGSSRTLTCGDLFNREHFGFADGCSQPAIAAIHRDGDCVGSGVLEQLIPRGQLAQLLETWGWRAPVTRWRGLKAGEFVLGYEDEDGAVPAGPEAPLGPDGTFMVYRKIEQHVGRFHEHTERCAVELGIDAERLRARIVGRWGDGTPLELSPDRADPSIALDRREANAFGYGDDANGDRCPLGAHVRRTNPRDGLPAGGSATMRHRIIRRGMPYGEAYDETKEDAGRGLIFICLSSSIARGFETIQERWCTDGSSLGLGAEPDYLLQQKSAEGAMTGRLAIELDPPRLLPPPEAPFVTVRGTEYLFVPGRAGLAWIGGLSSDV